MNPDSGLSVKRLGRVDYVSAFAAMRAFTAARDAASADEIWLLEHPPVFTLGQAGRPEHLLADDGRIPLVKTDRGGQITYHGPGQVIVYPLLDLGRRRLGVREFVGRLEQAVIELLAECGVGARRLTGAPGVYVDLANDAARPARYPAKIAALGLRIRRARSYHGLSLNVDMDLAPFSAIDPCGYAGMPVTQTRDLGVDLTPTQAGEALVRHLIRQLESP
ncbi:MAG: lipoyl(octanoyl) transferase LipB [Candidatus Accumulibacter sp.]|nr:lipoyl(octanoyl) transferase LipB [Accumulibacter sp.]